MDGQRPNSDLLGSEGSDEQESIDQDNQTGRSSQNVSFVGLPGNEDDVRKFVNGKIRLNQRPCHLNKSCVQMVRER